MPLKSCATAAYTAAFSTVLTGIQTFESWSILSISSTLFSCLLSGRDIHSIICVRVEDVPWPRLWAVEALVVIDAPLSPILGMLGHVSRGHTLFFIG